MRIPERQVNQEQIKDALLFAKQLAEQEIDSIDRLHKRTIAQLAIVAGVVTALGTVLGFIGFANLKRAAVAVAETQMREEVTKQVQQKLTKENINQIVSDQIEQYAAKSLSTEIRRELTTPPLSTSIRDAAEVEAQQLISRQLAPRRFTAAQSKAFVDALTAQPELLGYPVAVTSEFIGEPADYADEIRHSLTRSNVKVVASASFDAPPIEGVGVYYQKGKSESIARLIQASLQSAGVTAQLVPGNSLSGPASTALEIFVGSKPR